VEHPFQSLARPVRLLAAGGTIAMRGDRAVPVLDAGALVSLVPELASIASFEAETLLALPSAQLTLAQAAMIASRAAACAKDGQGVVVTSGTDTLEELAVLCALMGGSFDAPIVLTGANRPESRPGSDGAANLLDAVAVAGASRSAGLGSVVVFGGEIHAAMNVRKVDSTGPAAFGSPVGGPIGRVVEARVWLGAAPVRPARLAFAPDELAARVEIVVSTLGDDGAMLRHAASIADGIVVVAFGAGHLSPPALAELRAAVDRVPVVVTCRPDRGSMLFDTYGFEGAEADLRRSGAICAPFLSAVAARIVLVACLAAGTDRAGIAAVLSPWDAA
jgi:L-asparaginase